MCLLSQGVGACICCGSDISFADWLWNFCWKRHSSSILWQPLYSNSSVIPSPLESQNHRPKAHLLSEGLPMAITVVVTAFKDQGLLRRRGDQMQRKEMAETRAVQTEEKQGRKF